MLIACAIALETVYTGTVCFSNWLLGKFWGDIWGDFVILLNCHPVRVHGVQGRRAGQVGDGGGRGGGRDVGAEGGQGVRGRRARCQGGGREEGEKGQE